MTLVEVQNLTKRYGAKVAVNDVSFSLQPGKITGFLGPNGAGKTTTLQLLLGLAEPTSGTATLQGERFANLEQPWRLVGAVLDSNDFHPGRTGRNHLRMLARLGDITDHRVDEVMETVGLSEAATQLAGEYSLGMRQRLGLAAALLGDPRLLILDEPANGLDPSGVQWLRGLLRSFTETGGTVLMSSHLLAEAEHAVDHVLIVSDGRLIADTSLAELLGQYATLEAAFLASLASSLDHQR